MTRTSLRAQLRARGYVLKRLMLDRSVQRRAPTGRRAFDPWAPAEQGALDAVSEGVAMGWARRLDTAGQPVEVDLYLNGRFVGRTRADLPRRDLAGQAGFGDGRCGFTFALSPAAVLAGGELRVYGAGSGLELLGSPLSLADHAPVLGSAARRALRRLETEAPRAVTLADQAQAYGRHLAILTETDPAYPDAERPVSRIMAYVDARFHGAARAAVGPTAFFELFEAAATHFASAPAGLPIGPGLLTALTVPDGVGPFETYLLESLRLRAGEGSESPARLAGLGLDYLYSRRLPLELLGRPCLAWLQAEPGRWDQALQHVGLLAPAGGNLAALRAAAEHVGLRQAVFPPLGPPPASGFPTEQPPPRPDTDRRTGVQVVSADYGDSGLAANTRHSLAALQALGVAYDHVSLNLRDLRACRWAEVDVRETVLLHAQPDDAVELILRLPAAQSEARLIGFFMWETETSPPWFSLGLRLVDEVWTGSRFCADAFVREGMAAPVRVVGHAVQPALPDPAFDARARVGALLGDFVAYAHFDARSWITRKNPAAVARAFRLAFPRGDEPAVLAIKSRGHVTDLTAPAAAAWEELRALAAADPRIHLIDADLPTGALSSLMQASDVYLSLHRGEGFGYGPAEALLAGVPLIVSAYGGSLDFAEKAWLVPCRRRAIRPGEFVASGAGQTWGEPDAVAAARHLRAIYDDRPAARRQAEAARAAISPQLSVEALAARYRDALEQRA